MKSLQEITEHAQTEATRRGFRSVGIYHLIWSVHKLQPEALQDLLATYKIEQPAFIKMLENILRPRRAGGGVPQDKQDAALCESALSLANQQNPYPTVTHLLQILPSLQPNPIISLCSRFSLKHAHPEEKEKKETVTG
jgi:ATP-dependent Clp protease ATP-binding subunit ClpA